MIAFKDFLIESRSAPLYHGTPIINAKSILRNGFKPNTTQILFQGNKSASRGAFGVSFTRNIKAVDWYMKNEMRESNYVVFEVDQLGLNAQHKLKPVDYFGTRGHISKVTAGWSDPYDLKRRRKEAEEFAIVNRKWSEEIQDYMGQISPKYIVAVHYFSGGKGVEYDSEISSLKIEFPNKKWITRRG